MNYLTTAFGFELLVGETGTGTWAGGYREAGSKGGYSTVGEYRDARTAQIATCKEAQALAGKAGNTAIDPCIEALSAWKVE